MKNAYPVILSPCSSGYVVYIPDFNINTQGEDVADAMEMARDAIGLIGIELEDQGMELPIPSNPVLIERETENDIVTLVDIDFTAYRKQNDSREVRRSVTLPAWLDFEAKSKGVNLSEILRRALVGELNISDR